MVLFLFAVCNNLALLISTFAMAPNFPRDFPTKFAAYVQEMRNNNSTGELQSSKFD